MPQRLPDLNPVMNALSPKINHDIPAARCRIINAAVVLVPGHQLLDRAFLPCNFVPAVTACMLQEKPDFHAIQKRSDAIIAIKSGQDKYVLVHLAHPKGSGSDRDFRQSDIMGKDGHIQTGCGVQKETVRFLQAKTNRIIA
ncbi:hypothetical protein D3C71_1449420 [compost metagenome]